MSASAQAVQLQMAARRDLIAVVEACYDLGASDEQWLQGIADHFHDVLVPETGVLGYHIDGEGDGFRISTPVESATSSTNVLPRIKSMARLLEGKRSGKLGMFGRLRARHYERVIRQGMKEPVDRLVHSEYDRVGPDWMYTLGLPIDDLFYLSSHHIDGNGLTALAAGLRRKRSFLPAEREMYQMLSAHIKAGLRLRRNLPRRSGSVDVPKGGAALSASGRVLHAEGEARSSDNVEGLQEAAKRIDHCRTQKSGRAEEALAIWEGLIRGQWSLVERFDTDGKRFLLAHRNPEGVRDPRGLTGTEARVVGLAVRGYSDKLIGYHLGVAEGSASAHLCRAMAKLKLTGRVELVRVLGRSYRGNT